MDHYKSQAQYYNNYHIIAPGCTAVVHLEDASDVLFWNNLLQKERPGTYHFMYYSRSENGNNTSGCQQCLKYLPYLTKFFFICIDSDLRYLLCEPNIDVAHYVLQTYTYSWENHYCEKYSLLKRISSFVGSSPFDFESFLSAFSSAIYEPFLLLLYCERHGKTYLSRAQFRRVIKGQCSSAEMEDNGNGYIQGIKDAFRPILLSAKSAGFDESKEAAKYSKFGLNRDNAYLHVRGHNLYNLISAIGRQCSWPKRMNFRKDIMGQSSIGGAYWEFERIIQDISCI